MAYPDTYEDCGSIDPLVSADVVDYDRIQGMLDTLENYLCQCSVDSSTVTNAKIDAVESGLRQVISEVTDDVQEIQTIQESTGFRIMI